MEHNPDVTNAITHDRIVDLFVTASSSRTRRGAVVPLWRKLAGTALVRLGKTILGESRTTPSPVSLEAAGLIR